MSLLDLWHDHPRIVELRQALLRDHCVELEGVTASAPAFILATLACEHPYLVIAEDADSAGYMLGDLEALGVKAYYYPSAFNRHIKYGQREPAQEVLRAELLACLAAGDTPLIVSYPEALAEAIPSQQEVAQSCFTLNVGDVISRDTLRERLLEEGFEEVDYVYSPGQVVYRGSLVDIFSYGSTYPYRIDFFDDEIDSIRRFDIESQLSVDQCERAEIAPALQVKGDASGGETSLLSLLSPSYQLWVSRYESLAEQWRALYDAELAVEYEGAFATQEEMRELLLPPDKLTAEVAKRTKILGTPTKGLSIVDQRITFATKPQLLIHRHFDLLVEELQVRKRGFFKSFFLSESSAQAQRLKEILIEREAEELLPEWVPLVVHEGFEDKDLDVLLLTDHQIFDRYHHYQLKSDRIRNADAAISLKELHAISPGDYIVHSDHGVGQFDGLLTTEVDGKPREVVKLVYQNKDVLLVSIHSLHKLSKYQAQEEGEPQLSKLGTGAWTRLKERAKTKIKSIARDLIALYAARKEQPGFAFSPDSYLQHEMEASFAYEETPDQLKAIEQIKADMESNRPMDRLVCGDVGFGKTEVAIRAAFKAVADSKQVAVLVPTTILAYQHYQTFSQRLEGLPCRIEYLSRAKSDKQSKAILADLAEGRVDILIGTHRLLGKGVAFKSLGLLIIDEEQKFGVKAKEQLRKLQVNVDTLTLSATPIPRTLQFSLMGARDLSNINTPPRNRQPVTTRLIRWSQETIADAIGYELARHGQVFFVHNRIESIHGVAGQIQECVPGIRIAIAHGRLTPSETERILLDFAERKYDLLLATTIIENGIDMPNVNTIFINSAHRYGLSDLHQLRGRVGRGSQRAYCYLITPPLATLTEDAARRVKAIESFSDLGSGMRIALQDLDIRGAGNILGTEQSGFIADLGFETYRKVFEEAVREVKQEDFAALFAAQTEKQAELGNALTDTTIDTDLDLSLPHEYIPQDSERILLYRELDELESDRELKEFADRLRDRFGALPPQTKGLLMVPRLRRLASHLGIVKVSLRREQMILFLPPSGSAYYQSKAFDILLKSVASYGKACEVRESREGHRSVKWHQVTTVYQADKILSTLYKALFARSDQQT